MGRQPWIVQGLLLTSRRTRRASAPRGSRSAWVLHRALRDPGVVDFVLMRRYARPDRPPRGRSYRPRRGADGSPDLLVLPDRVLLERLPRARGLRLRRGDAAAVRAARRRERGVLFETIGPVWDGNEVWLVIAGGATFAAFPTWYGTMFSGFYLALLLILFFLIIRVVSFEWRERARGRAGAASGSGRTQWGAPASRSSGGSRWRTSCTASRSTPRAATPATSRSLQRTRPRRDHVRARVRIPRGELPDAADDRRPLRSRSPAARILAVPAIALGAGFLIWTIQVAVDRNDKDVFPPVLPAVIAIAAFALAACSSTPGGAGGFRDDRGRVSPVATLFVSLYPRVMVSSPDFGNSLTVSGAASAHYTLAVMSVVAPIVTPLVLLYQGWSYYVFRARVTGEEVRPPTEALAAPRPAPPHAERARARSASAAPRPSGASPDRARHLRRNRAPRSSSSRRR